MLAPTIANETDTQDGSFPHLKKAERNQFLSKSQKKEKKSG